MPQYYQCFSNETISIIVDGKLIQVGTLRALGKARLGACTEIASTGGTHPYTCASCNALAHGKTSTLNHKVNRSSKLKNQRSDLTRATKKGVNLYNHVE